MAWTCGRCGEEISDDVTAVEVRFGYVEDGEFNPESSVGPLCDDCAIYEIKEA